MSCQITRKNTVEVHAVIQADIGKRCAELAGFCWSILERTGGISGCTAADITIEEIRQRGIGPRQMHIMIFDESLHIGRRIGWEPQEDREITRAVQPRTGKIPRGERIVSGCIKIGTIIIDIGAFSMEIVIVKADAGRRSIICTIKCRIVHVTGHLYSN